MKRIYVTGLILFAGGLFLAGCGGQSAPSTPDASPVVAAAPTQRVAPPLTAGPTAKLPSPTATPEPEYRWSQLLSRDDIFPIYEPRFLPADEVDYPDDELVMGVAIDGQAKAYPVGLLNFREMVNDELAGIPILVTW